MKPMKPKNKRILYTRDAQFTLTVPMPVKASTDQGQPVIAPDSIATLKGYALKWGDLSTDRGGYKVRLIPGSASFSQPTHALYHHDFSGGPLGDTSTNTLRILPADAVGVPVEIDLPNTTLGRDTHELVRTGRVKGMSFSMIDTPDAYETKENGQSIMNARAFTVDEITVTAIPAFTDTNITVIVNEDDDEDEPDEDDTPAAQKPDYDNSLVSQRIRLERHRLALYLNCQ